MLKQGRIAVLLIILPVFGIICYYAVETAKAYIKEWGEMRVEIRLLEREVRTLNQMVAH